MKPLLWFFGITFLIGAYLAGAYDFEMKHSHGDPKKDLEFRTQCREECLPHAFDVEYYRASPEQCICLLEKEAR